MTKGMGSYKRDEELNYQLDRDAAVVANLLRHLADAVEQKAETLPTQLAKIQKLINQLCSEWRVNEK